MSALPTGTITFLFTDVEGSTRLWEAHPTAMRAVMARHDALLTAVFERNDGVVVRPRGEGDSLFAVFVASGGAISAWARWWESPTLALRLAHGGDPMPYAKLDNKERFRVPREAREALNLRAGDAVAYAIVDGELRLRKAEDPYAGIGPVARGVEYEFAEHPERFHTLEAVMAETGITQVDLDAVEPEPGLDDE